MPGLPPQPGLPGVPNPLAQRNVPGMPTAPGVPGMPGLPGMGRSLGNSPDEPDHSADPLSRAQNLLRRQGLTEDDLVEEVKTDLRVKAYLGKVGGIDAGQNLMETRKEAVRQAVLEFPIRLEK